MTATIWPWDLQADHASSFFALIKIAAPSNPVNPVGIR
jgi:hypothetical protein